MIIDEMKEGYGYINHVGCNEDCAVLKVKRKGIYYCFPMELSDSNEFEISGVSIPRDLTGSTIANAKLFDLYDGRKCLSFPVKCEMKGERLLVKISTVKCLSVNEKINLS